ncbi:hypothetical protein A5739_01355 [Mycobacterium colombiense]|nr:hypothetical protein [Mycobacterium colombiense]OMC30689.1 hypothetical protein A5739_01355 [Mycobacterium colombiense]
MPGDLPPAPGSGPTAGASGPTQWSPVFPTQPQARPRTWPAALLAGAATVLAIAALIVALTRPTAMKPTTTSTAPTYTAADASVAQRRLCDRYKLAARSVETDTNGTDKALARVALSNAAGMLDDATADPAIDAKLRDAVRALAAAYRTSNALSSFATDAEYRAALDDIVAKDAPVRNACGS